MVARGFAGLKSPGDDTGVLFAVRVGGCRVLSLDGVPLAFGLKRWLNSIVSSWS